MDAFDRLYRKSKTITKKNSKSNEWLRNATRSIGKSALDIVNEFVPATMETGVSMRDIRGDLKDTLLSTKKVGVTKAGSLMSMGKSLWENSLEDLKSGNFYNQQRINSSDGGPDFNIDIPDFDIPEDFDSGEDDYSFDVVSDDGQSSVQMNHTSDKSNDVTQINIETNLGKDSTIVQVTQQQTEVSIKTAQQLAEVSNTNTKIMMAQLSKLSTTLSGHLSVINDNVSAIATVISDTISPQTSIAGQYYEDSLKEFREIKETITGIKEVLQVTSSSNPLRNSVNDGYGSGPSQIFQINGGINLKEYGALIKKQFDSALMATPLGMPIAMGKMASSMGGMGMMDDFKKSPISAIITSSMKKMIPKAVKDAVSKFDNQLKETLTTGLVKVGGLSSSTNPILQFIGNLFGIKSSKYTADKKNYNKGPMAWNGVAHRTLVDVIPMYLSQIASAVTGTEQRVFDYEQGKYESLTSIRNNYDRIRQRNQLSSHDDIRREFTGFVNNFALSQEDQKDFSDKFDKYLMAINNNPGVMDFNKIDQITNAVGGNEQIAKMIQKFMRIAPKDMVTATYGSHAFRANQENSDYERKIEKDPTANNFQYIKNGMTTISPNTQGGLFGLRSDKYGHDTSFYLRKILQTINTVVPVRIIKGGKGFNKRMLSELGANNLVSDIPQEDNGTRNNMRTEASQRSSQIRQGLSLDDLDLSAEELSAKIKEENSYLRNDTQKEPVLRKLLKLFNVKETSNIHKFVTNISDAKGKSDKKSASIFNKLSDSLFSLLFGDENGEKTGAKGLTIRILNGVKGQMTKFGKFIDKKMIGPLNDSLFGDDGLITKIKESETINKFKDKLSNAKGKAVEFLFGKKEENGKRTGGLFSETFNSISGMGATAKDFILHDEDGVVGSLKGMYRSVTASIKKSLGVEDKDTDTEKVPISKKIASGANSFVSHIKHRGSEWMDLIFGGKDTKFKDAKNEIMSGFSVFKNDMKGKKGKLGASTTLGILGSFFLPGGPIAGALLGLGTGIVSESSQLKNFLFGKTDENGSRVGGVISKEFQSFFKDNKTGMSIGAVSGTVASIGLLPSFFMPGGPIGGALIGGAISLAHRSGVFNDLIYGEGGSEDNITGGITKFIKDHYKKDGNVKSTFMDAGMGAGVGILGSFFLPGGPITGALLGSAASIAINTDKFKNLMFGEELLDENGKPTGKRKGGLFHKFTDYIGDKVLLPLSNAAKETQVKIMGFIEQHMVNPLKVAMKPFQIAGKNFMDGIRGTINDLKESFRNRVTKPIGDSVEEHILKPLRNAFGKIFGGLGKIVGSFISAPFKMIQGAAAGLNKTQVKNNQSEYDIKDELDKQNQKTKGKYDKKLNDVRNENAKRKKWRNPFKTSTKENQKSSVKGDKNDEETVVSDHPYTEDKLDDVIKQQSKSEQGKQTTVKTTSIKQSTKDAEKSSNINDEEITNKTQPSMPYNLQFFASSKTNKGGSSSKKTSDVMEIIREKIANIDMNIHSIFEKVTQMSSTKASTSENAESSPLHSSVESNVKKISDSVDGQLNGVGRNVNKILRVLMKKNGMSDDDVAGENNKKYSNGGKLKRILLAPINLLRMGVQGAVTAVHNIVQKSVEGVTKIAKGLMKLPKVLWNAGKTVIKGVKTAALGIAKGVATTINAGLVAVGNVITNAASGFGTMIGKASEGFGQLIGGALGGLGSLLHGVGLISKELAPVIAKGITAIVGAPFKFAGAVGKLIFGKRKGRKGSSGGISHVIVDEYVGENRVITALRSIEFAILHGAPMDGKGPKYKGTSVAPVHNPGEKEQQQKEREEQTTRLAMPMNLQFFASAGKNGNGLPNTMKAETKEQEKAELQTRVAEGSASEINERFDAEDDAKEERSFREKILGLFKSNNKEQKKQGINWSSIFSKKGLITGALIMLAPLIFKLLPGMIDFFGNIGGKILDWLGNTAQNVANNAESQGGITGVMNGVGEQLTSIKELLGKDREEYKIGENGEILTDENGNPIKEKYKDGLLTRVSEFFTPTTTKIDHETGEAYQMQQYDSVSRGKIHAGRTVVSKGIKSANKISKKMDKTKLGRTVKRTGAYMKESTKDILKQAPDKLKSARTKVGQSIKGTKIEKIISLGKEAFDVVKSKFVALIEKHSKGANTSKLVKFLDDAVKVVFKPQTISRNMGKFGKLMSKIATAAGTLATSELFWGITGAVEGVTNAAYTFEVDSSEVDWKMRLIAGTFRALLATSIGGFVDLADAIIYEISGTSFVNELAVLVYNLMSSDEDNANLQQAKKEFNEKYAQYVEEEYQKYVENQQKNGQDAMTLDEFKQSDLSTSRQEFNSEQNKSLAKKAWDTVKGAGRGVKKVTTKVTTKIKEGALNIRDTVAGGAKAVRTGVRNIAGKVVGGAKSFGTSIKSAYDDSALKSVVDGTMNAGKLITTGVAGILKSAWTGNKDDLITLPAETDDPSTIFAKYALIGANVLATPLKLMITTARKTVDTAKATWDCLKFVGNTVSSSVTGRINAAWNGDDYNPPVEDESKPLTKIASMVDAGVGVLMAPITFVVRGAKGLVNTTKLAWEGLKLTGNIVSNSVTGRISAAWTGEEYESPEVDESHPITKIASVLDAGIGFLMSPITLTVRGVSLLVGKVKELWEGVKTVGNQAISSAEGRISAAWTGEEYEPEEFEDTPAGKMASVVDHVTGITVAPISLVVRGVSMAVTGVKSLFGTIKNAWSSIKSYADVFGGNVSIEDYWKEPDADEDGLGGIKTAMFYIVRGFLAVPFYLTSAVSLMKDKVVNGIKGIANKIANVFGAGDAFNTDDSTGGNGAFGGLGGTKEQTSVKKTSLNGFTYYSQNDSTIKDQSYNQTDGTPGTMGERGCGPTALSMVASELTGKNYDPVSMANIAESQGYSTDVGTTTGYFGQVGSQLGMNVSSGQANPTAIKDSLNSGNPVILQGMGGSGPYTSEGHYVVGVGMKDGNVLVNDPRGAQYSKSYSMDQIMDGASGMWSFSGGKGPVGPNNETTPGSATSISTNSNEAAEKAVVNAIYSVKERNQYSQSNREHVGDTLNGAAQGSGDCSSTVRWAYQQALGIDPGSYTGAQVQSSAGYDVDKGSGGPPNEANLRPGDLLFYTRSGRNTHSPADVGHVEMYVGNNTLMGHGSGIGPKEREMSSYRLADYIGARRFIGDGANVVNGFNGVNTGNAGVASSSSGTTTSSSMSNGFSLSNLFSGAINAVNEGVNKFFGINTSSSSSTSTSTGSTTASSSGSAANLTGGSDKQKIWNYLLSLGYTKAGAAGVMGNLEQESGNTSIKVQGDYSADGQKSQEYTKAADSGTGNFIRDGKGYGLAQWTYWSRKQGLLDYAKSKGVSVGDLGMQLEHFNNEMQGYPSVVETLKTTNDVGQATATVCNDFERPGTPMLDKRKEFAQSYYNQFANSTGGLGDGKKSAKTRPARYQMSSIEPLERTARTDSISSNQSSRQLKLPKVNHATNESALNTSNKYMDKIFDYLGKIVTYLESTSSGINKLNQKEFSPTINQVNTPSYTSVNGGIQQSKKPDTSKYELGKRIAYGQLT